MTQLIQNYIDQILEANSLKGLEKIQSLAKAEYCLQEIRIILENYGATAFEVEAEIQAIKNKVNMYV